MEDLADQYTKLKEELDDKDAIKRYVRLKNEMDSIKVEDILTQEEIFHILQIVGESKFAGKEVEKIFQLTLKLQKMYLDLNKFKDKQLWIYTHQKTYH